MLVAMFIFLGAPQLIQNQGSTLIHLCLLPFLLHLGSVDANELFQPISAEELKAAKMDNAAQPEIWGNEGLAVDLKKAAAEDSKNSTR